MRGEDTYGESESYTDRDDKKESIFLFLYSFLLWIYFGRELLWKFLVIQAEKPFLRFHMGKGGNEGKSSSEDDSTSEITQPSKIVIRVYSNVDHGNSANFIL